MKLTNMITARHGWAEIWSEKVMCSLKMKPRLRAERVMLSEELCVLSSCF